jgi:hypothetical protein
MLMTTYVQFTITPHNTHPPQVCLLNLVVFLLNQTTFIWGAKFSTYYMFGMCQGLGFLWHVNVTMKQEEN